MKTKKKFTVIVIAAILLASWLGLANAQAPQIWGYDPATGTYSQYLGNLNRNPYDPNSIYNPYGKGNPYDPNSVNNPFGLYGNPYSPYSTKNPFTNGLTPPQVENPMPWYTVPKR